MTIRDLEALYDYSYWANAKLLEPLSRLTPQEFVRPVAGSYGSVRNTLVHMMSAEGGCLDRCGGPKRGATLLVRALGHAPGNVDILFYYADKSAVV
jgi:uncharacterized damage-inducible protein DinB